MSAIPCTESGLAFHTRARNIYLSLEREPDTAMVDDIRAVLDAHASDGHRLFIDVRKLSNVSGGAVDSMRRVVSSSRIQPSSIFYKGRAGFEFASEGNKVIVMRRSGEANASPIARAHRCRCDGKGGCGGRGHCSCHGHHDHGHSHGAE